MYKYEFDATSGGLLLKDGSDGDQKLSKEPRPVFAQEMNTLGFQNHWHYENQNDIPYLWAESNNYFYRGEKIAVVKGGSLYQKPALEIFPDALPENETLLPIALDEMIKKNREVMNGLVQFTIKRIYNYWRRLKKKLDCFHVAFSGGKDSLVLLDLVRRALPKSSFIVVFGDTGMEFPDTYKIVDAVEADCKKAGINFYRAASHLTPEQSWKLFGPPSNTLRWCCSVHKAAPQTLKIREVLGKNNFVGADFVGVRAQESLKRSNYKVEEFGRKQKGQYAHNSILEWNSAEIWTYIFMRNLPINDAYKKGNARAGCLFCPMSGGKADFFRNFSYPHEVARFVNYITETVNDENIQSYIENGGWLSRRNGRDLISPLDNYSEEMREDFLYIKVTNPKTDWREWIKTLGEVPFNYEVETNNNVVTVKVNARHDKTPAMKNFKSVFRKTAACVGCGVCESNCVRGAISFQDGLHIENCVHCLQCHDIFWGCLLYHSTTLPKNGGYRMKSLNSLADHAPKTEWFKNFFEQADVFKEKELRLGPAQTEFFKRLLYDAELLDRKTKNFTDFAELVKRIGWDTESALGLILINLAHNNPQIRWYIENLPLDKRISRKDVEENLQAMDVSAKDARSIAKAFKRLCETPLGTVLCFGKASVSGKNLEGLTRTKARINDGRVFLYGLYRFAEACEGYYQFNLRRLMSSEVESAGVSPIKIFGLTRDESEQFLNGLSANYHEFIDASFTHDLEKISLNANKKSEDVLELFGD